MEVYSFSWKKYGDSYVQLQVAVYKYSNTHTTPIRMSTAYYRADP